MYTCSRFTSLFTRKLHNIVIILVCCSFCCLVSKFYPTLRPHGLQPARLLCPCDFLGKKMTGLPFPSPGDLLNLGIEPAFLALAGRFFTTKPLGKINYTHICICEYIYVSCIYIIYVLGICCYSVAKSRLTLCNPLDCSTPGFPVLHRCSPKDSQESSPAP